MDSKSVPLKELKSGQNCGQTETNYAVKMKAPKSLLVDFKCLTWCPMLRH